MMEFPLTPQAIVKLREAYDAYKKPSQAIRSNDAQTAVLQDLLMKHAGDLIRIVEESTRKP